jgi:hypothetical protein
MEKKAEIEQTVHARRRKFPRTPKRNTRRRRSWHEKVTTVMGVHDGEVADTAVQRFGEGLAATTDNFGALGETPSHPELLDWLAHRFLESGGSLKAMHRLTMLSNTYQMSGDYDPQAAQADPENRLLWRWLPRRLEAEAVRDSLLAVSGLLDRRMGGSRLHVKNREFLFNHTSKDETTYDDHCRSLYLPVIRNHVYDALELFDFPDPAVVSGDRASTTVAPGMS